MIEIDLDCGDAWNNSNEWMALSQQAVTAAFAQTPYEAMTQTEQLLSISIILSDNAQVHALNQQYRDKDKPTNVLSFPMLSSDELAQLIHTNAPETLLGDLALAQETCMREAADKEIDLAQHVTHLIVHGTLHLLGHDHIDDDEAAMMESTEIKALASMGLPNPYNAE